MKPQDSPAGGTSVDVRRVQTRADWREFFGCARRIQGRDPNWIEPLRSERRRQWSDRSPFFLHARAAPFIATQDGSTVGAISAQVDQLQPTEDGARVGYFGQLEAIDCPAVFAALIDAAGNWLLEQRCGVMRGPFDLGINQSCGLLVDGNDTPPMVMMGHAPDYYARHLETLGLERAMDLLAYVLAPNFPAPETMTRLLERFERRLSFRTIDFSRYAAEIDCLRDIFNDAWSRNWGFVPLTEPEFRHMGKELRQVIRSTHTCIALVDGEPAGFLIALPNINELIADLDGRLLPFGWARLLWRLKRQRATTARVPLMGVLRRYQRGPLGAAISLGMIDRVRQALHDDGIAQVEMSWILETNKGMNSMIASMGGRLYKRYRLYQKALGA